MSRSHQDERVPTAKGSGLRDIEIGSAATEDEICECKAGMFPRANRRQFLAGAGAVAGAAAVAALPGEAKAKAPAGAVEYKVANPPWKTTGRHGGDDGGYGTRSQFETEVRWFPPSRVATWTPLASGHGIITPSALHFERHHAGIPDIDPKTHSLIIHGMVDRPMKFTVDDLKKFPSVSKIFFMECSGNTGIEYKGVVWKNVQKTHGLTSTSEWTGVPLSTLLAHAGIKDGAGWVLAEGADAALMTRSLPIDKCMDDVMVAYAQNGEAIRPEQGYPMKLLVPGFEGNISIKWLRRLEISDKPFMTREETSKYSDIITKTGKARLFTWTMDAKSVITFPSGEMKLPGAGFYEVTGLAWSGRGKIKRVEVSTDGGVTWQLASLQDPILDKAHTRFSYPWMWDGKTATLQSRATDETGYIQPTLKQIREVRGENKVGFLYHQNGIQSWKVASDGSVENVQTFG
jgi:sulfane dehydrogenase subunit SoxC